MFTKMQLGIMNALSTVLFQETNARTNEGLDHWLRKEDEDNYKRAEIYSDDDFAYELYVRKIRNDGYLLVVRVKYFDEYGAVDRRISKELCYIPVGEHDRFCWDYANYAKLIERIIGPD